MERDVWVVLGLQWACGLAPLDGHAAHRHSDCVTSLATAALAPLVQVLVLELRSRLRAKLIGGGEEANCGEMSARGVQRKSVRRVWRAAQARLDQLRAR